MPDGKLKTSGNARARLGPSPEQVRQQLAHILGHRDFEATERTREFLRYVVDETLAQRAHRLKGYTIAIEVFGRGKDFDPNIDPIVRIQAGRLRRALEHYYLVAGGGDPIRIDIPKGQYVPTFAPRAAAPDAHTSGAAGPASAELTPAGPTIAVLPPVNVTGEPEQSFFVDGLVEEMIGELSRYRDVIAIPCRDLSPAPNGGGNLRDLGRELGARFLLGGSVRRDPATLKGSAYLVDANTGRQLWSESYKIPLETASLIETQETIARSVIATIADAYGVLATRLSEESSGKTPDELSTYEALLRYHHYMLVMTPAAAEQAFVALRQAVDREPDYGPAWSALANLHAHAFLFEQPGFDEPLERATEYARRGVALEPQSQLARTIMAFVYLLRDEMDLFFQEADAALALNPHSPNYVGTIGYMLVNAGEFERGARLLHRAMERNPCHPKWFHHALCAVHFARGEYEHAYLEVEHGGFQVGFWDSAIRAAALGKLGRVAEAGASATQLLAMVPDFERRAREITRRSTKSTALIEDFLDGLRKAGLRIDG